jgi:hypothetical protein
MVLYCCLEWLEPYVPILPLQSTIFFQKVLFEFKGCYISKVQQCNTRIWNRDWNVVRLINYQQNRHMSIREHQLVFGG